MHHHAALLAVYDQVLSNNAVALLVAAEVKVDAVPATPNAKGAE
jgi:hypothetical protein